MPIGELSRRSGVSTGLLRMWERRYGIPSPRRTPGGRRVYSRADERLVRAMRRKIDEGFSASVAARLTVAEDQSGAPGDMLDDLRDALARALDGFDEPAANAALDRILAGFAMRSALAEVVLPYLQELGARWESGEVSIAQEHFATMLLRGRLLGLARNWGAGSGPRALLACPPGEHHDLALICFGLGLREEGWTITLLGPNTPGPTIAEAARALEPDLVVVAAIEERLMDAIAGDLGGIGARHRLLLAGPGASAALARRAGAELLDDAPMAAAAKVAARA
jgi:MerR family transcriptional regulator, light-induced transcriptional regulator